MSNDVTDNCLCSQRCDAVPRLYTAPRNRIRNEIILELWNAGRSQASIAEICADAGFYASQRAVRIVIGTHRKNGLSARRGMVRKNGASSKERKSRRFKRSYYQRTMLEAGIPITARIEAADDAYPRPVRDHPIDMMPSVLRIPGLHPIRIEQTVPADSPRSMRGIPGSGISSEPALTHKDHE